MFGAGAQTAASIRKHITRRLTATFHELAEIGDVSRADLCDLVLVQLTGHLAIDLETVRTVRSAAPLSRWVGFFDDNTTTQLAVHAVQRLGLPTVNVMSPDLAEQLLCEWEAAQQENIAAVLRRIWLPLCSHRISGSAGTLDRTFSGTDHGFPTRRYCGRPPAGQSRHGLPRNGCQPRADALVGVGSFELSGSWSERTFRSRLPLHSWDSHLPQLWAQRFPVTSAIAIVN